MRSLVSLRSEFRKEPVYLHSHWCPRLEGFKSFAVVYTSLLSLSTVDQWFQQGLNVRLRLALHSQELVVSLSEPTTVLWWPKDNSEEEGHHHWRSNFTLGQALIRRPFKFRCVDMNRLLPCLSGVDLLGDLQELVLRDVNVLDIDETVLGLLRVTQDTDDSLSDRIQRGGAEHVLAAVEELGLALLPVEQDVFLKTPVQKGIVADQGIREIGLGGSSLAECLVHRSLEFEYGQNADLGVGQVTTKVGRKKALHARRYSGFDEDALPRQACSSNGRDDGILAFEGSSDRVYRWEIGCPDCNRVWKACRGGWALDDGDVEFSRLDECIEHWHSERSRGLWRSISVIILHSGASSPDGHLPRQSRRSWLQPFATSLKTEVEVLVLRRSEIGNQVVIELKGGIWLWKE